MGHSDLSEQITREAKRLGAVRAGITDLAPPTRLDYFQSWLDASMHGTMTYMAREDASRCRQDPKELLSSARSIICVAIPYEAAQAGEEKFDPSEVSSDPKAHIARYARGRDYHHVLWRVLGELVSFIEDLLGRKVEHRICVDSAPILEREYAERAGLGFIGKNTMLIAPGAGSYLFLGEVLVDLDLQPAPSPARAVQDCGRCTACLDACPTGAFDAPYKLNANRCISYLTIEHRGNIDETLMEAMGAHVFGCDICQSVCPYNKVAPMKLPILDAFKADQSPRSQPSLAKLASLGTNQHKRFIEGSAMRRADKKSLQRNVAIALGNSKSASARDSLERLESSTDQVVRQTVDWAKGRLHEEQA